MKTLYVTDLDGTLLNRNDTIDRESLECINALVEKGLPFTYATARSLVSASVVTKGLRTDIPVIVYNGVFIIQPKTGEILHATGFSKKETETVMAALERFHISPMVYSFLEGKEQVSWVRGRENEGIKRYLSMRKGDKRLRPLENSEGLYSGDVFYFTCIGEKEELMPIYTMFANDEAFRCTIQQELYRTEYWCEIMPKNATKAKAIQTLQQLLGYDRIVSFGDAINDIPMFEISDACYAVEHAVDELKEKATAVIGSNENNGVGKWLMENICL